MPNLFPELPKPEDLRLLTDAEVQELLDARLEVARKIAAKDAEVYEAAESMTALLTEYEGGVEQIKQLREELSARGTADTEFTSRIESLAKEAGIEEPEAEDKATAEVVAEAESVEEVAETVAEAAPEVEVVAEADPVAEAPAEAEPVVASVAEVRKPPLPAPTADNQPISVRESLPALIASIGIPDIDPGTRLDQAGLVAAVMKMRNQNLSAPAGFQDKAVVASADYGSRFPEERKLTGDFHSDWAKIQAVISRDAMGVNPETQEQAVLASGGLCAPVTPYYELWNAATAARPVRDALAGFNATRGGINVAAVPTIADVTDAVGIKTAAQDAAGGTNAQKSCQVVECPDFTETLLSMIYHCVQFGNLNSRAWPEQVAQFNDLVMAAHARLAEQALLDGISNASVAVSGAKIYGATSTVIFQVTAIVSAMRSRFRLPVGYRFRALFPAWARDLIASDVANSQFERFGVAPGDVDGLLRRYGIEPTWYLDTATGAGQIFSDQFDGPLRDFPTNLVYYVYPEGSFLFLDGGTLELGIVRDSTLNSTNDYQIFGETFENVAFVGPQSYEVTTPICNDGTVAAPATAITCSAS